MARKTRRSVPIENRVQTEKPAKLRLPRVHLGYVPLLFIVTVTIMVLVMIQPFVASPAVAEVYPAGTSVSSTV